MPSEAPEDQKPPLMDVPVKSSMEILHELFETFDAEPPVIVKKEKSDSSPKKSKKSKKKHKHKDKKEKKRKDKKRKRSESSGSERSEMDLAEILIKQEKETHNKKIKIEGTELSFTLKDDKSEKEAKAKDKEKKKKDKIQIKLKTKELEKSSVSSSKKEEGELSDGDDRKKRKKDEEKKKKPKKSSSQEREELRLKIDDLRNRINENHRHRSRSRDRDREHKRDKDGDFHSKREKDGDFYGKREKDWDFYGKREKDGDFYGKREKDGEFHRRDKDKDRDRDRRDRDKYKEYDHKSRRTNPFYKEDDFYRGADLGMEKDDRRDRDRHRHDRDRHGKERYRGRSRSRTRDDSSYIDKKKLLEIARKNAIQMMKSGSLPGAMTLGPQAQEKVIAAIKAGGKTIEELTDFCKTLSKKEELGDLSSNPDESDSDADVAFHHPFQIKDRPTSITMNIKNSVPLPIKSTQERSTELRMQFPVSSGQLHRKTENEWVPVSPKKASEAEKAAKNASSAATGTAPLAIEAPPAPVPPPKPVVPESAAPALPGPQLFPAATVDASADISLIVSQRLTAIRKLQENPHDVQALGEMYRSNKEMQTWAQSKQQPGLFTGTTGVQILSQAELASGYQAWAKKDQLQSAIPVSGGMGMHLLQKMGWKPGEGLGKEKTGALEPLLLEVKLDKKGLVANEEQRKKKKQGGSQTPYTVKTLQNKHPVSLLGEYASKRKLGAPQYNLCFECGPDHKKNFVFQVVLNGVEYKPNIASPNKKEAKAAAASICLQELGLLLS